MQSPSGNCWPESTSGRPSLPHDAREALETVCAFILEHARKAAGRTWKQAPRRPVPAILGHLPAFRALSEHHVRGVPESAVQALEYWAEGFPALVVRDVPSPAYILELQAQGRRCVTLLERPLPAGPYQAPLTFALHDLRHLSKFADPAHYFEQVGFFTTLSRARRTATWRDLEAQLDAGWHDDRDQVLADMNGSSVFLFAALKMKLKMAARRALARSERRSAPLAGRLTPDEEQFFARLERTFLDALGFSSELRRAAIATSARRDDPARAALLARAFADVGRQRFHAHDKTRAPSCSEEREGASVMRSDRAL